MWNQTKARIATPRPMAWCAPWQKTTKETRPDCTLVCKTKGTKWKTRTSWSQPQTPHQRIPLSGNPPRMGNLAHHLTNTPKGLVTSPLHPKKIHRHTHSTKTATTHWTNYPYTNLRNTSS